MDTERHRQLVASLTELSIPWRVLHGPDNGPVIRLTPVASLETARLDLGISSDGWWVRIGEKSASEFPLGHECVFLLPILEVTPVEARQRLLEGLQIKGIPEEFIELFPFEDVVATGLASESLRWASLALDWAKLIERSPKVAQALAALADSGPTQKLRHEGRRLLKRK
ncbi:hypothetical protein [Sorangium cellulosum]|uniref:hypothetical protein n=1 Tax=Sorangium cellulosum TaxID=56 RepID=UPI0012FFC49F|nr:hypothetical protein [Sorangium cellulosum]